MDADWINAMLTEISYRHAVECECEGMTVDQVAGKIRKAMRDAVVEQKKKFDDEKWQQDNLVSKELLDGSDVIVSELRRRLAQVLDERHSLNKFASHRSGCSLAHSCDCGLRDTLQKMQDTASEWSNE